MYQIEVTRVPTDATSYTSLRPEGTDEDNVTVFVTSDKLTEPELAMQLKKLMNDYISFSKEDWDSLTELRESLMASTVQACKKAERRAYWNGWTHAYIVVGIGYAALSLLGLA